MRMLRRILAALVLASAVLVGTAGTASAESEALVSVSPCSDDDLGAYGYVGPVPYKVCIDR